MGVIITELDLEIGKSIGLKDPLVKELLQGPAGVLLEALAEVGGLGGGAIR